MNHNNLFRPCIDLYQGKVKQIVGSTLNQQSKDLEQGQKKIQENFSSELPTSYFAKLYSSHQLFGGHIIMLDGNVNEPAAELALTTFPMGFHIGGGLNNSNASTWLDKGAEKVIFTSYLFENGKLSLKRLEELSKTIGKDRIVIDLSCIKKDNDYLVAINGWQVLTDLKVTADTLQELANYGSEFLIHAVDLEGKMRGIDQNLVMILAESPLPVVYAGGISTLDDIHFILKQNQKSKSPIAFTIGSALDVFGGKLNFEQIVKLGKL